MNLGRLFGFGRVTSIDDTGDAQVLQVTQGASGTGFKDRILDKIFRLSQFGIASVPPLDASVLMIHVNGDRSQTFVVATHHSASRLKNLQPGDSALYDVRGAIIKLSAAGLEIDCAGQAAVIKNYSTCTFEGDIHVTGDVVSRSSGTPVSLNAVRDAFHAHKHSGVATGGGLTGLTDHDA